jgi:hypothetical protein
MKIVGCKNLKEVINAVFKAWWNEVGNYSAIFCTGLVERCNALYILYFLLLENL